MFDRHSGVDLVDAVAASCSSGRPYTIGDRRYIDGGFRSNADNADLAAGYARVLVLSPFGGRSLQPLDWGMHLATQVAELRAGGSSVETIFPATGSEHLFGANAMDPSLRAPAARAGYDQGRALAEPLTRILGADDPDVSEIRFSVRLTPRADRDAIDGVRDGVLWVRVSAPPVDGAANVALQRLLASELKVPKGSVRIVSGQSSRSKVVALDGIGREAIVARWPGLRV